MLIIFGFIINIKNKDQSNIIKWETIWMPPHGWIIIFNQSNAYKNIDFCPTTPMHVVFGSKLEKVVNKLSFEQNVKNHHKFWLLQNYTNNLHWKSTQKHISWIRLARKFLNPTIQLFKHTKPLYYNSKMK